MTRKVDYVTESDIAAMTYEQLVALDNATDLAGDLADELMDAGVYVVEHHCNHVILKASELWTANVVAARFGLTVEHIAADIHRVVVAL